MEPFGTLRVRPSSAHAAPNDLRRSRRSMTGSVTPPSRVVDTGELALDEPPDLLVGQSVVAEALDRVGHQPLGRAHGGRRGPAGAGPIGDEGAGALTQFDDAFMFELPVGFGDRVRIDDE